jgi:hypothetical protein
MKFVYGITSPPAVQPINAHAMGTSAMPGILGVAAGLYIASVPLFSFIGQFSWIPQVVGVFLGIAWLLFGAFGRGGLIWSAPILLYVGWAAWAGFSGVIVTDFTDRFLPRLTTIAKVVAVTWLVAQCVRSRSDLMLLFLCLALTAPIVFYLNRGDILATTKYTRDLALSEGTAKETTLGNPNTLAMYGVVVLAASTACVLAYRSVMLRSVAAIGLPCGLYFIAASGSRKGMISIVVLAAMLYWYHFRLIGRKNLSRKIAMTVFGIGILIGAVYFLSKIPTVFRLTESIDARVIQNEPRVVYFVRGMEALMANPLAGMGLGGFGASGLAGRRDHYTHSTITETLVATGLPGFLLYAGSFVSLYALLRAVRRQAAPGSELALVNVLLVFYWTVVFNSITHVMINDRLVWPILGGAIGYLAQKKRESATYTYPLMPRPSW